MRGERRVGAALVLGALLATLLAATPVAGHPLGNFSINRYAAISVEPGAVEIRYLVDMAEIPTFQEMQEWQLGASPGDPQSSAYLARQAEMLGRGLRVHVDGRALALRARSQHVVFTPGAADLPTMKLAIAYRAPVDVARNHRLTYRDENFAGRLGWREVVARAAPGVVLAASSVPERDRSGELSHYPADLLDSPPQVSEADIAVDLVQAAAVAEVAGEPRAGGGSPASLRSRGARTIPIVEPEPAALATGRAQAAESARFAALRPAPERVASPAEARARTAETPAPGPADLIKALATEPGGPTGAAAKRAAAPSFAREASGGRGTGNTLTDLMTRRDMGTGLLMITVATAMVLGAFHALEPGHGKTVVAAYLVGSRGTAWHAVLLGLAVTVSHTAGVFLLGAVTLYASRYVMPDRLYPWLGAVSGLAIAGVGLALLRQRWRGQPRGRGHGHEHGHAHPGQLDVHGRDHARDGDHAHDRDDDHVHGHGGDHAHEHGQRAHDHHASHDAHYGHGHRGGSAGHAHADHQHAGGHHHGGRHHHHHVPEGPMSLRSLLAMGLSGGIVPCPGALVVLLSALAWRRLGLGIVLVVAFSVGLAAVLVAIGLLVVHARRLIGHMRGDGPLTTRWLPLASSVVITALGALIAVQALAGAGIIGFRLG
jgi:ABC-type nickel/cobalt efflux system permease component RcnA